MRMSEPRLANEKSAMGLFGLDAVQWDAVKTLNSAFDQIAGSKGKPWQDLLLLLIYHRKPAMLKELRTDGYPSWMIRHGIRNLIQAALVAVKHCGGCKKPSLTENGYERVQKLITRPPLQRGHDLQLSLPLDRYTTQEAN